MVAGLKPFQTVIEPLRPYKVRAESKRNAKSEFNIASQLRRTIESFGGDPVVVYAVQFFPPPEYTPAVMFNNLQGIAAFDVIPNYILVVPTGDAPDAIVLSGISAAPIYEMDAEVEIETFVSAALGLIPPLEADIEIETFVDADLQLTP